MSSLRRVCKRQVQRQVRMARRTQQEGNLHITVACGSVFIFIFLDTWQLATLVNNIPQSSRAALCPIYKNAFKPKWRKIYTEINHVLYLMEDKKRTEYELQVSNGSKRMERNKRPLVKIRESVRCCGRERLSSTERF